MVIKLCHQVGVLVRSHGAEREDPVQLPEPKGQLHAGAANWPQAAPEAPPITAPIGIRVSTRGASSTVIQKVFRACPMAMITKAGPRQVPATVENSPIGSNPDRTPSQLALDSAYPTRRRQVHPNRAVPSI
jgi:hypothetical protein